MAKPVHTIDKVRPECAAQSGHLIHALFRNPAGQAQQRLLLPNCQVAWRAGNDPDQTDAGPIAANVYLSVVAEGLAAWFHKCDRPGLERSLGLRPEQKVLFAHSLGLPQ